MNDDPRDGISDFTEITDEEILGMFGSFFRAIGWGAVAGGGFFMVFTVPFGLVMLIADGEPRGLVVALLPLGLSVIGTLAGMICFGLPLTALLRHLRRERTTTYSTFGIIGGLLMPTLFTAWFAGGLNSGSLSAGIFLGLFGAMAGGVCGNIWGAYRESCTHWDSGFADDHAPPPNPFHDMIH